MERLVIRFGGNPAVPCKFDLDFAFDLDKKAWNGLKEIFDALADIYDILGDNYNLDRLREIVEADRDGRCIVLPCKVGDTVYMITKQSDDFLGYRDTVIYSQFRLSLLDKIGKTVFLTREAAEAALKGKQNEV